MAGQISWLDMIVDAFLLIPLNKWLSLRMIYHKAFLNRLLVVIGTTTLLSTQNQAFHQFVLRHVKLYHRSHLVTTFFEHLLQCLSLRDSTREAIEDHAFVFLAERVIDRCQDADH